MHYLLPNFFQRFVWVPLRLVMIVFCSLEIKGIINIKETKGNFILASNHISEMDPLLIVSCLPFFSNNLPLIYVSRQKNLYTGSKWKQIVYGGTFFEIIGAYPSYKGLKNYRLALQHHLTVIQRNNNVAIFPYGGIIRANKPVKARGGVAFLAYTSKLPIIPVKIAGTENFTLPNILSGKKKVAFTFGKPIYPDDLFPKGKKPAITKKGNDYEIAAEYVMSSVKKLS